MRKIKYHVNMPYLWKHPNGTFYACWRQDNKNRRKSLGTSDEPKAQRRFQNFQRDLYAGRLVEIETGARKKLNEFADELVANKDATTSEANAYLYQVALNKAKACWKDIPLQHITSRHIDVLVIDMIREGLKPPTINKNIRHIKGALSKAYEWEYINKPIKFPKPLEEEEQLRFLTVEELRALFGAIDDPEFADFCEFSAYTALRSGEIIRLTFVDDVDNPKGFLRISSKQKNRSETRIPINKHARSIIDRCRVRRQGQPTLFRFNTVSWVSQKFRGYADNAGLHHCRFHDLRHTYGSHMAIMGKNPLTIKELMRHKSIASTMIYAKLSPEHLREESEGLDYGPMPVGTKKED